MQDEDLKAVVLGLLSYINKNLGKEDQKKVICKLKKEIKSQEKMAKVTTAVDLSDEEKLTVTNFIHKEFGEEVLIEFLVNKEILGGIKIKIDDILIDKSFAKVLNNFSDKLVG